ncbi:hypothetical protein BDV96DRAFT_646758 [Lophiotrema nucula]|uniref:Uncharacterized protein n=1 Tax=Lophiotrema nucula TaxID=690887 RepID=A0A6A5Z908_9PLEO|nr:hypothetical protein BDV96DRAFT_646758 [Lophiotrema nucula]
MVYDNLPIETRRLEPDTRSLVEFSLVTYSIDPAILCTCQLVRAEAKLILDARLLRFCNEPAQQPMRFSLNTHAVEYDIVMSSIEFTIEWTENARRCMRQGMAPPSKLSENCQQFFRCYFDDIKYNAILDFIVQCGKRLLKVQNSLRTVQIAIYDEAEGHFPYVEHFIATMDGFCYKGDQDGIPTACHMFMKGCLRGHESSSCNNRYLKQILESMRPEQVQWLEEPTDAEWISLWGGSVLQDRTA